MASLPGVLLAVQVLSFSPAIVAQTGYYSVFRSHDKGLTWSRSDSGLPRDSRINAFGAVGDAMLAGTDRGIYTSRDRGLTWTASGAAASAGRVLSFATTGTSVHAGTERSGILVSQDEGSTWALNGGTRFGKVRALLTHAGGLYAGTDAQGVFVSRDAGHTWTPINDGLPSGAQVFTLVGLRDMVFAGLYGKGLYALAGQARSWRKVAPVSPLVLATTGETLLAGHNPGGIFRSDDLGATWSIGDIAPSADLGNAPVWELAAGPEFAMGGVASGVYRSDDRGRRWVRATSGLPKNSSGIAFLLDRRFTLTAVHIRAQE